MKLDDKVALITGGAGNLGIAIARRFLEEGARVLLVGRGEAKMAAAARALGDTTRVRSLVADVTASKEVAAYAQNALAAFGPIDIFVNNAGVEGPNAPITEFPEDEFDRVMQVNIKGVFLGMKYVSPVMREGGSVIIMSSIAGLMGSGNFIAYTTSKHAEIGIMREAAIELAPRRIRVNTLNPGFVESDMLYRILRRMIPGKTDQELRALAVSRIPLGRCVEADEIARMAVFLGSDDSQMATGQTFVVDGGTLLQ